MTSSGTGYGFIIKTNDALFSDIQLDQTLVIFHMFVKQ